MIAVAAFIKKYFTVFMMIALVIGTWQVQEWRHGDLQKDAVIDASNDYEARVKAANKKAFDLELELAEARKTNKTKLFKVKKYVESKSDNPICFDNDAIGLFNSNRH